ncbi:DUF2785 domain-containing protein [Deinococcus roseus]|uniref:DUF2785 domain-containing protein n=1 Tax=Deinococcus roseus TaxID=392414 RepID=A0ABQ2CW10_9DEIO|nr:DUF2785 domain-containing protein [Deinococcus roseus]GGJ19696.1 hypothetical protein GCM10008938_02260 [Deinococcus roseus]
MKKTCLSWLFLALLTQPAFAQDATCGEPPYTSDFWMDVRSGMLPDQQTPDTLSPLLFQCLASPDPVLRDVVGYEVFANWLRGGTLTDSAARDLTALLLKGLQKGIGEEGTPTVFGRTFSALILSEVMRRDARNRFLSDAEYQQVVTGIAAYLKAEKDLRAFNDQQGWMHGVAHAADVLWRMAENPRTTASDLDVLLDALKSKVAPEQPVFYTHNEPERMARVISTLLSRSDVSAQKLDDWLYSLVSGVAWRSSFDSELGMARLHNTRNFFQALYFQVLFPAPGNDQARAIEDTVRRALTSLDLY